MKIELDKSIVEAIGERDNIEEFVNSVLAAYLHGGFIRKADIAGVVTANKVYRRLSVEVSASFDTAVDQFSGMAIESERAGDVAFIPSERLFELIQQHQVILVMKSPRQKEIPVEPEKGVFVRVPREEYA